MHCREAKRAPGALVLLFLILGLVTSAGQSLAQLEDIPSEFSSGDDHYPIYLYLSLYAIGSQQILLIPGEGLSGEQMRMKFDGSPGWGEMLFQRGYNAFCMDLVGCGKSPEPQLDNYDAKMEKTVFGVHASGYGAQSIITIAHGTGAAFALKARSWDASIAETMVLIDPIGPQGSQPFEDLNVVDILAAREDREELAWQRLGFGKRLGELRAGLDIDLATAEAVMNKFEYDQPAFSVTLLTPMDSPTRIREPIKLAGLPVLVVRTPAADTAQIARETAFVQWMLDRGLKVETVDLGALPEFAGLSGLPWIGDLAEPVLDYFLEWYQKIYLALPGS